MNYMKQVAEMLGVELGEEFDISGLSGRYKLSEFGLVPRCGNGICDETFCGILRGTLKIKELPFHPDVRELYCYVNPDGKVCGVHYDPTYHGDRYNVIHGNCYRTEKEAEKHVDEWVAFFKGGADNG